MWVADMDFQSPPAVLDALRERVAHGVFGYGRPPPELLAIICERMDRLYSWQVDPDQVLFLPGLVCGLNLVCRALGEPGDEVLVQTPVYPPFLSAPANQGKRLKTAELALSKRAGNLFYEIDFDAFEKAITQRTRLFILCHPHNPVGRVFKPEEITRLAEICARHNLFICSDEVHGDLLLDGRQHKPFACLAPELASRCMTLMAPSKTFNIAGLGASFAIIQDPQLRRQVKTAAAGIVTEVNILAYVAALAAYRQGQEWLTALLQYLNENRDFLLAYLAQHLPDIRVTCPEATYLAWLDCRAANVSDNPQSFFLRQAKVAFNDGATFGPGGEGFVRLNFGCPRATLEMGLERLKKGMNGAKEIEIT
jgi:cystathionine beta-lyase